MLFGGDGGDHLEGGDGNDLIDTGNGPAPGGWGSPPPPVVDEVIGGLGNDVIIIRTPNAGYVTPGAGNDQVWFVKSSYATSAYITDAEPGDAIYWNNYKLAGGTLQIVEAQTSPYAVTYWASQVGALGEYYEWRPGASQVYVQMPDGSSATIDGFENGDFGLSFDHDSSYAQITDEQYDSNGNLTSIAFNVAKSSIAFDGISWNLYDLPGRSAANAVSGPETMPIAPLP